MKSRFFLALLFFAGALRVLPVQAAAPDLQVDADFPGGNVRIVRREGNTFTLAPDLRDSQGWWFYFNFRLRSPAGEPVTLQFEEKNPMGVRGPALSLDEGRTWRWLGKDAVRASKRGDTLQWSFQSVMPPGATEARFAFAPPYVESHLIEWLAIHHSNPAMQVSELCRSRKGRSVELIRAGCLDLAKVSGIVLLTSRHHACESMATYAMEGLLSAALADDDLGRRWRERWQIIALPFTDKDGVEDGDQGKNRKPHDHNRDYNESPLYPEVAAWMKLGASIKDRVVFSLDMHCPYISGRWNDRVYVVGSSVPGLAEKEKAFISALEPVRQGPLPFNAADSYLPFGVAWNTGNNYSAGRSNGRWAGETFPKARFAGSIEIAYAEAMGAEVNSESARALGQDLARAILERLER